MADNEWNENDHVRTDKGRFVASGTIWYVDESLADHAREHAAHDRAHDQQHAAEQQAITLAAETIRTWKAESNEWRGTLTDRDEAYAKVGQADDLDRRVRVIEASLERRTATEAERLANESRDKLESDRQQGRQFQLLGFVLGVPALIGAVAGVIALVKG